MSKLDIRASVSRQLKRVINAPKRIRHEATMYLSRDSQINREWLKRHRQINRIPGVSADKNVTFLSKSAKLDFEPSGFITDGEIHLSALNRISDGVILAPWGGVIRLEENVFLGPYCVLYGHGGITIGKNTAIAGHTFIVASNHTFADLGIPIYYQPLTNVGITIGEDVWIGCGTRILDGVSIGNHCVVGAGAVVTKSLPPFSIAVGVPAKVVGYRRN